MPCHWINLLFPCGSVLFKLTRVKLPLSWHREIHAYIMKWKRSQRANNAELWFFFLISTNTLFEPVELPVVWDAMSFIRRHSDGLVKRLIVIHMNIHSIQIFWIRASPSYTPSYIISIITSSNGNISRVALKMWVHMHCAQPLWCRNVIVASNLNSSRLSEVVISTGAGISSVGSRNNVQWNLIQNIAIISIFVQGKN